MKLRSEEITKCTPIEYRFLRMYLVLFNFAVVSPSECNLYKIYKQSYIIKYNIKHDFP